MSSTGTLCENVNYCPWGDGIDALFLAAMLAIAGVIPLASVSSEGHIQGEGGWRHGGHVSVRPEDAAVGLGKGQIVSNLKEGFVIQVIVAED